MTDTFDPFASSGSPVPLDALGEEWSPDDYGDAPRGPVGAPRKVQPQPEPWPEPIPLSRADTLAPFPVDALPSWAANYVHALATFTQTPPEMAATCVLGAIATLTGGRVWIEVRPGWTEGTNLYAAIVASPGMRKSPVHDAATAPLREHERQVRDEERPRLAREMAARELREQAVEHLRRELPRMKGPARADAERDLLDAAEELERTPVPVPYRLVAGDVTPEKLIELLAEQRGRLALLSDEDTVLGHLLGRYSKQPPIEAFLSAYSNKAIDRDRRGLGRVTVERPALTILTCIQPDLLRHAKRDALIVGRGLLDRFAIVVPRNTIGERDVEPPLIPQHVREDYRDALLSLAAATRGDLDVTLTLTPEARAAFVNWQRELERRRGLTGDLSSVQGWAAKADGLTARIVALLHVGGGSIKEPVQAETVQRAVRIVRALAEHALTAADEMGLDPAITDARALLRWAVDRGEPFTARDVQRAMKSRFRDAGSVTTALQRLRGHNLARSTRTIPSEKGGRPRETWEVSPFAEGVLSGFVTVTEMRSESSSSSSLSPHARAGNVVTKGDRTSPGEG